MQRRRHAFTLIELLVVIAIVGLLVSLMMPALSKARHQAKLTACRVNLRNIWVGVLGYSVQHDYRLPYAENINLQPTGTEYATRYPGLDVGPDADPFDPACPTTIGNVLKGYVPERSWTCPAAITGYPDNPVSGRWKMTYNFSTAGPVGEGIPYDKHPYKNSGGPLDPLVSNYAYFDGRPLEKLDGRRYVQTPPHPTAYNTRKINGRPYFWQVRRPIVADMVIKEGGVWTYPHFGVPQPRQDLRAYQWLFEQNTSTFDGQSREVYLEMHAYGDDINVYQTRAYDDPDQYN